MNVFAKLRAARRSHCHDCSCSRCQRIEQLLQQVDQHSTTHPENGGLWLIEGCLVRDDQGRWFIQSGETITSLNDHLYPWAGYHVVILIGAEVPPVSEMSPSQAK